MPRDYFMDSDTSNYKMKISHILQTEMHDNFVQQSVMSWFHPTLSVTSSHKGNI